MTMCLSHSFLSFVQREMTEIEISGLEKENWQRNLSAYLFSFVAKFYGRFTHNVWVCICVSGACKIPIYRTQMLIISLMHTHTHTCAHTHMCTHTRTHIHTCTDTHMYTHTLTHMCTHTHTYIDRQTDRQTDIHTHKHTHTSTHTYTYTYTHTRIHAHTCRCMYSS